MTERIDEVLALASKLPSGLNDEQAAHKLSTECGELTDALGQGDLVGALTEVADIVYYACKVLDWACGKASITTNEAFDLAIAKYRLRAQSGNPKNDADERAAVWHALRFGVSINPGLEQLRQEILGAIGNIKEEDHDY